MAPKKDGQAASGCQIVGGRRQDKSTDDSPLKNKQSGKGKRNHHLQLQGIVPESRGFVNRRNLPRVLIMSARQQQTDENTVLDEDSIHTEQDYSSAETADTDLTESNCDLDELIAQKHFENTFAQDRTCTEPEDTVQIAKALERKLGLKCCTGCKFLRYCSKECQAGQWITNKPLCKAIQSLLKLQ